MPLTQLKNQEDVDIQPPDPDDLERVIMGKQAYIAAQLLHPGLDADRFPSFTINIDGTECVVDDVRPHSPAMSIEFVIASAIKPQPSHIAEYFFVLYQDDDDIWHVDSEVILSISDNDEDEGFNGLKPSEQFRLLGH